MRIFPLVVYFLPVTMNFFSYEKCSKQLYFSFIYSYLNYANITWASTQKSKIKGLLRKQKHASRIIYFKDKNIRMPNL